MNVPLQWLEDHLGPIEILAFTVPPEADSAPWAHLLSAVEAQVVRLLDLEFIHRSEEDSAEILSAEELPQAAGSLAEFAGASSGLLTDEDILDLVDQVEVGETVAVVVAEHIGLLGLLYQAEQSGSRLVSQAPVLPADLVAALDEVETED